MKEDGDINDEMGKKEAAWVFIRAGGSPNVPSLSLSLPPC